MQTPEPFGRATLTKEIHFLNSSFLYNGWQKKFMRAQMTFSKSERAMLSLIRCVCFKLYFPGRPVQNRSLRGDASSAVCTFQWFLKWGREWTAAQEIDDTQTEEIIRRAFTRTKTINRRNPAQKEARIRTWNARTLKGSYKWIDR